MSTQAARVLQHSSACCPAGLKSRGPAGLDQHTQGPRGSALSDRGSALSDRGTFRQRLNSNIAEDASAVPKRPAAWPWGPRAQARRLSCQHRRTSSARRRAPCRAHAARRPAAAERAGSARRGGPRRARPSGGALLRRPPARAGLGVQHAVAGAAGAVRGRADLGAGGRRRVVRRRTVRPVRRCAKGHQVRAPQRPQQPPEPGRARSRQLRRDLLPTRRSPRLSVLRAGCRCSASPEDPARRASTWRRWSCWRRPPSAGSPAVWSSMTRQAHAPVQPVTAQPALAPRRPQARQHRRAGPAGRRRAALCSEHSCTPQPSATLKSWQAKMRRTWPEV